RLMEASKREARQIHIVLLLGLVPLDGENELPARLQVLRAPLFLEHRREGGIIDVADVAQRVRRIRAIQDTIRLPARGIPRPHRQALEFATACRGDKRAKLLELQLGLDADAFEIAL